MLESDCLEQEGHIAKWRRVASGEEHAGFAVYRLLQDDLLWHNLFSDDYLVCSGLQLEHAYFV